MPKISFNNGRDSIEVEEGSNLMQSLMAKGIPVASSCKGKLVCGKCYVEVLDGSFNLSPVSDEERDFMEIKDIPANCRMSCSCKVNGDICLDTPYW